MRKRRRGRLQRRERQREDPLGRRGAHRHPGPSETADEVAGLGVKEIVDHYESLIRALDQPPVLIGHSYGGLFVELLLDRGLDGPEWR